MRQNSKKSRFCVINPDLWEERNMEFCRLAWEGLTADEIAARLNLPIAETKRRLAFWGKDERRRRIK